MSKTTPNKSNAKMIVEETPTSEKDIFSNTISADDFMKQIKAIQQSNDEQDINLRNAAKDYMNALRCV